MEGVARSNQASQSGGSCSPWSSEFSFRACRRRPPKRSKLVRTDAGEIAIRAIQARAAACCPSNEAAPCKACVGEVSDPKAPCVEDLEALPRGPLRRIFRRV